MSRCVQTFYRIIASHLLLFQYCRYTSLKKKPDLIHVLTDAFVSSVLKAANRVADNGAGYITTPGYPLEYPPHQNCRWVVTAPEPSQRVVLNFNPHFELEKLDCR
ncbi:unnamed protein product [Oncorhynchus mykiss]|uniref:CUB domain-containing protein n=1 Tax=Oncorhynchus mykiss TaxID=8022 RepID=A0A060ZLB5_ONCMY|nr:unnamed protein product [Oncorhynchus mykiss]